MLAENVYIGDSNDEAHADLAALGIDAVLNTAHDLQCSRGWNRGIEYAQVGIIDGPGNSLHAYYAAVLALSSMLKRGRRVMVCCHTGSRSLAVIIMHVNFKGSISWDRCVELFTERTELPLPESNAAHRAAFDQMDWTTFRGIK